MHRLICLPFGLQLSISFPLFLSSIAIGGVPDPLRLRGSHTPARRKTAVGTGRAMNAQMMTDSMNSGCRCGWADCWCRDGRSWDDDYGISLAEDLFTLALASIMFTEDQADWVQEQFDRFVLAADCRIGLSIISVFVCLASLAARFIGEVHVPV